MALGISSAQRSLYMLLGGAVIVFTFSAFTQIGALNFEIFKNYGLFLALFGTIIPPMLLNAGFPKTGLGLGSIVASLELPVSVMMAYLILKEEVVIWQWFGILLIILAIVIMNINFSKKKV
jgi:drug/metabolite transporter (DMT)-like permease